MALALTPVRISVATITALGIAAPWASATLPLIVTRYSCANMLADPASAASAIAVLHSIMMLSPIRSLNANRCEPYHLSEGCMRNGWIHLRRLSGNVHVRQVLYLCAD